MVQENAGNVLADTGSVAPAGNPQPASNGDSKEKGKRKRRPLRVALVPMDSPNGETRFAPAVALPVKSLLRKALGITEKIAKSCPPGSDRENAESAAVFFGAMVESLVDL